MQDTRGGTIDALKFAPVGKEWTSGRNDAFLCCHMKRSLSISYPRKSLCFVDTTICKELRSVKLIDTNCGLSIREIPSKALPADPYYPKAKQSKMNEYRNRQVLTDNNVS
ncbi:hypothetical protein QYM36_002410 [Artemia franciscana]|uniref:Uncharacterized protein n=1 Tax=Artemia franciscana TaxID=6661 RepID=A0AA88LEY1_ARTSF|nr:hypothetical protein QYM36_002409 [Artemia franciscana]KAK2724050.1 hypothetical protein QYM36_002410 [Artemia franciscana]